MNEAPTYNGISPSVLRPRLVCLGYVKIGGKAAKRASQGGKEFQPPMKYDHFRIRTRVRADDGNYLLDQAVHQRIGPKPTELDVRFLWPEPAQNFKTSLTAFEGRKLRCEGNGEKAFDRVLNRQIPCTCPLLKQHKGDYPLQTFPRPIGTVACKPYGVLSLVLEAASYYGGYHVFRTTSWETINSLTAALEHFRTAFGRVDWIPFKLIVYPHTVSYEENGKQKTSTAYGVSLVLRGSMETAFQIAARAHGEREQALAQLMPGVTAEEHADQVAIVEREDQHEVAAEFHPADALAEPDYETITDDEDDEADQALEQRIRRALELAEIAPDRINKAVAQYSDRLAELAAEVEEKRPEQWKQAGEQLAADESKPMPAGAEPLGLFD